MKRIGRMTVMVLAVSLLLSILAACGSSGTKQVEDTPGPVTINFWTISLSPTFDDYVNARIKKFEDANPDITIKWTDLPYGSMENKLLSSIAGNQSPDVVNLNTAMALKLADKNALVDLNKEATEEQLSIYFESLLHSARIGDSIYAFPWYYGLGVLSLNKEIYEAAGLDPNQPPSTWEEMKEHAVIIKEKTGKYGFVPIYNPPIDLFLRGVPIINEDKTQIIVNTPEALEWAKWNKDLYDSGVVPKESITADAGYATDKYQGGQIASFITGSQFLNRIKNNAKEVYDKTVVAPIPTVSKDGKVHGGLMNVVVPTMSKHHEEAILFAHFITNDESQLEFAKVVNILPSTKEAAKDPFFTEGDSNEPEDVARRITATQTDKAIDFTLGVNKEGEILEFLWKYWKEMLLGRMTPEEMLKKAEADMQAKLDEILAEG
ncbi:ABC transporter substrate-binding protein [Paenibacillus aceti]|uniref:Sugar ABC transporter substrate-binding protein n=1 Tax=Paenibacillus aceti TaxID=1820010 RepID=A0ABQ1VP46_9BACL|nr:sugar ABC transporter substrate-binding protein [Paenibacillus aceti]GGF85699.1 sugar ABC transporter substrate-binding protein [Paenibacillus aceti]